MSFYSIEVSKTAEKQLKKLKRQDQIRVLKTIKALAQEPRPSGCRKIRGYENIYRIRVGVLRVIYSVSDKQIVIVVLKVGHRKDVYRF
jgi:mRNA interferase RelE/StbE